MKTFSYRYCVFALAPLVLSACAHEYAAVEGSGAPSPVVRFDRAGGSSSAVAAIPHDPPRKAATRNDNGDAATLVRSPRRPSPRLAAGGKAAQTAARVKLCSADSQSATAATDNRVVPAVRREANEPKASAGEKPLTLEDFMQIALEHNPTLVLAQAEIEKERGNWTQVGLYPNPTIGYLRSDPSQAGQSRTDGAFIQQQIITGGKLRLNREIEEFGIANSGYQRDAQIQRVRNDVRIRFYQVLAARQRVTVARETVTLARQAVKTTQDLWKAKQVARADVLQAEVQLEVFRSSLERAKEGAALAWQHLVDMAGVSGMQPVPLAGSLEAGAVGLNRDQLWVELQQNNSLLHSLRAQVGIAQKTLERQRAQPIPDLTVQVVGEVDHTFNYSTVSTLLALPVPIFDRNQGAIYNAYHELVRAQREVERTELVLNDQFTTSFASYRNGRRDVNRLEKEVLPRAKENLELTTQGYKLKQFDVMRVLAAQQTYLDLRMKRIDALLEMQRAKVELEGLQLTGGLNPATIGAAIQGGGGEAESQRRGVLQNLLQQQQGGALRLFNPGTTR